MTNHGLAVALGLLMASPVLAQSPEVPKPGPIERFDVGIGYAPFFAAYLDEMCCQPVSGWFTFPADRFRIQIDYLKNVRRQPRYTDSVGVSREDHHEDLLIGAVIKWPWRRGLYWLVGGAYWYSTDRWCVSPPGEPFSTGFECSRDQVDVSHLGIHPLYGIGLDHLLGSRFFVSMQYRARLHPVLGEARIGVGFRF